MKQKQKPNGANFLKWIIRSFVLTVFLSLIAGIGLFFVYGHISPQLPNVDILRDVNYQIPLTVYSSDGKLIAQFGEKKRIPISIDEVPEKLIQAFLAAEDDRFFDHPGVDYQGLLRAAMEYVRTGQKRQGGSTITMQVARNFFLTPEKTFMRKIREIVLAIKIETELEKPQILQLYLNKIYFGHRSYGVGAAAQLYYGKMLDELNLPEMAMIAGLPKAPSRFNPITNPQRAATRRDYVLRRMLELDFIDPEQFQDAHAQPVTAKLHGALVEVNAPYIAEMVRLNLVNQFEDNAYTDGYKVYTTCHGKLQHHATTAVQEGLHEYDERHGFKGAETHIDQMDKNKIFRELERLEPIGDTIPGAVISVDKNSVRVHLRNSKTIEIDWDGLKWARKYRSTNSRGAEPKSAAQILRIGDIVRVRTASNQKWRLAQVPKAEGALVSIDPYDGSIIALTGGFDFFQSSYNRVTQARRQPGSGFKPILYTRALEEGFTAASIINDAPVVFDQPSMETEWRPENYSGKFYGPTRLRIGLRNSRNLVSIRLMREIGIDNVIDSALRFGLPSEQLPNSLSLALGSGSASPLEMARVFAVFANGGYLVDPYFINRIESVKGDTVFQAKPKIVCSEQCKDNALQSDQRAPRVMSPQINYLMNSLLQDVIRNGTATRALKLNRNDLAGKTGTTNEQRDAWFNGFNPSLVAVAWVGFDSSEPLGNGETGGRAALPIWMHYMGKALETVPDMPFQEPEGIVSIRIDPETGLLAPPGEDGVFEKFQSENVPRTYAPPKFSSESDNKDSSEDEIQSLF